MYLYMYIWELCGSGGSSKSSRNSRTYYLFVLAVQLQLNWGLVHVLAKCCAPAIVMHWPLHTSPLANLLCSLMRHTLSNSGRGSGLVAYVEL